MFSKSVFETLSCYFILYYYIVYIHVIHIIIIDLFIVGTANVTICTYKNQLFTMKIVLKCREGNEARGLSKEHLRKLLYLDTHMFLFPI